MRPGRLWRSGSSHRCTRCRGDSVPVPRDRRHPGRSGTACIPPAGGPPSPSAAMTCLAQGRSLARQVLCATSRMTTSTPGQSLSANRVTACMMRW
jgi:hypothetical protein